MADVKLDISTQSQQYEAALRKIEQLHERYEKKLKALGPAAKGVAKGHEQLGKEAKKAYDEIRGPQERYQRRMQALNRLLGEGQIKQREYGDAARRAQEKLDRAGRSGARAFGSQALGNLRAYAAGVLSIGAAVGVVSRMFADLARTRREAAQEQVSSYTGLSSLAQLAGGDPQKLKQLLSAAKETYLTGGPENLTEAGRLVFELESAGGLSARKFFGRLYGVTDPAETARAAGVMRAALGAKETGTFQQLTSKALAAAAPATGVSAADILGGAARAAAPARQLGLSDEELLAATSVVAQTIGSGEEAGTQVSSLLRSLAKKGFVERYKGKGLGEMLGAIPEMTTAQQITWFGRQEAQRAYVLLDRQALAAREKEIRAAQASDLAGRILESREAIPRLRYAREQRAGKAYKELSAEQLGIMENIAQARIAETTGYLREQGTPELAIQAWEWGSWAVRRVLGNERIMRMGPGGEELRESIRDDGPVPEKLDAIHRTLERQGRQQQVHVSN